MAGMGVHNAKVSDFDPLEGDVLRVFCEQIRVRT